MHTLFENDFRRHVFGRATERIRAVLDVFAKPEISQLGVSVDVEQYIFGLYVPVYQVQPMQVFNSQEDFGHVKPCHVLVHRPVALNVIIKIATRRERHHKVNEAAILVKILQPDDEWEIY